MVSHQCAIAYEVRKYTSHGKLSRNLAISSVLISLPCVVSYECIVVQVFHTIFHNLPRYIRKLSLMNELIYGLLIINAQQTSCCTLPCHI